VRAEEACKEGGREGGYLGSPIKGGPPSSLVAGITSSAKHGPLILRHGPLLHGRHGGSSVNPGNVSSVVESKMDDQCCPPGYIIGAPREARVSDSEGSRFRHGDMGGAFLYTSTYRLRVSWAPVSARRGAPAGTATRALACRERA